jgi:hypothetical protein
MHPVVAGVSVLASVPSADVPGVAGFPALAGVPIVLGSFDVVGISIAIRPRLAYLLLCVPPLVAGVPAIAGVPIAIAVPDVAGVSTVVRPSCCWRSWCCLLSCCCLLVSGWLSTGIALSCCLRPCFSASFL